MTELGNKHECLSCSTKFYDLGKSELVCPKCGADQNELAEAGEEPTGKGKRAKGSKKKAKASKQAKAAESKETDDSEEDSSPDSEGEEE
jgi:uncharacterized protein (TIGR02300 family)